MLPRLPLLQRYLLGEVCKVFAFVLFCVTVLLVFVGLFQQAAEAGLHPLKALRILPYAVTMMLPFTIPAALLLTVSMVYGRLTGDQELTAAKAAGIHPLSMMWPALLLAGSLSVGSLLLTDQIIPWSMVKMQQHLLGWMEDIFLETLRTKHHFSDGQHGLYITVTGLHGKRLQQPMIRYVKRKASKNYSIQAAEAQIEVDLANRQILVTVWDGIIDIPGLPPQKFRGQRGPFPLRWDAEDRETKPRHLPVSVIRDEIRSMEEAGEFRRRRAALMSAFALVQADFAELAASQARRQPELDRGADRLRKLNTEIHSRYALACSCFFFVLLGTPFSMRFGKSQYLTNFLLCFVPIVCGYYPLMLGVMTQAKGGLLPTDWPLWIPNALLAVAALAVLRKVIRY